MSEAFSCKDCSQLIIYHEGQNMVVNFQDGEGGYRGDRHLCPYRSGSDFDHAPIPDWEEYYKQQQLKHCPTCNTLYIASVFCLCPNCFKVRCRNCEKMRTWRTSEFEEDQCPYCSSEQFDIILTYPRNEEIIKRLKPSD